MIVLIIACLLGACILVGEIVLARVAHYPKGSQNLKGKR